MHNAFSAKAYSAANETSPLASDEILRRNPTERDVQMRNSILRDLPLRSPSGPQRVARCDAHGLPLRSGPRDRRPRQPGRLPRSRSTNPATSSRSAASLTPTTLARTAGREPEQFCPNMVLTYNSPDKHLGGVTYGGYSDSIVVDERFVLRLRQTSILPAPRHCCAPASPRTLRCATGASAGQQGRRRRPRRAGPYGGQARPCNRSPCRRLHHFTQQDGGRASPRRR